MVDQDRIRDSTSISDFLNTSWTSLMGTSRLVDTSGITPEQLNVSTLDRTLDVVDLMEGVVVASPDPIKIDLRKGSVYYWCRCGRSRQQPFCDGSHKGTGITPLRFVATEDGAKYICQCKASKNPPYCDNTHTKAEIWQKYSVQLLKANSKLQDDLIKAEAGAKQYKGYLGGVTATAVSTVVATVLFAVLRR
eukprot:m.108951 g.108951  ORF g.108951 m.108951 type:complete len:192 (+) comp27919_c2_seq2:328-903(+)